MNLTEALRRSGLVAVLVVAFVWPALHNGQPFFYPDTTTYIRGADAGFSRLTDRSTVWSERVGEAGTDAAGAVRRSLSSIPEKAVLAGRSIYYGAVLYVGHVTGAMWPAVLLQAAIVLLALGLTLASFGLFTWWRLAGLGLIVAALTPASFFASLLIPDIFAAITILAVANLLFPERVPSAWTTAGWVALASAALLFHTSHVLLTGVLLFAMLAWALAGRRSVPVTGVAGVILALLVGIIGEAAFSAGVTRLVGAPPIRPPFLMARMIADGPGQRYLEASCPDAGFAACEFVDRLPIADPDVFLWSSDSAAGVFATADAETRRRLSDEQLRFAIGTLAFEPTGQIAAGVRNTWTQLLRFGLREFNYSAGARRFLTEHVPQPYLRRLRATRAWDGAMPASAMAAVTRAVVLLSIVVLIGRVWRHRSPSPYESAIRVFAATVVVGIVVNAAICGALSTPHDRYQARVVWLLPVIAALLHPRLNPRLPPSSASSPADAHRRTPTLPASSARGP